LKCLGPKTQAFDDAILNYLTFFLIHAYMLVVGGIPDIMLCAVTY
jgi:hypothetical protein